MLIGGVPYILRQFMWLKGAVQPEVQWRPFMRMVRVRDEAMAMLLFRTDIFQQ